MDVVRRELIEVLRDAAELLALPGNNFDWSSWEDAHQAIGELNELITSLESGETPERLDLTVLFAPTGPIQEVSLSSGWADDFLTLAERFDTVTENFYGHARLLRSVRAVAEAAVAAVRRIRHR